MRTMSVEDVIKMLIYQIYVELWLTSWLSSIIMILFRLAVVGSVILIPCYHSTIFKSGQRCNCRTVNFNHIIFSHFKQSMPLLPCVPGPMVIPMLFSSIPTIVVLTWLHSIFDLYIEFILIMSSFFVRKKNLFFINLSYSHFFHWLIHWFHRRNIFPRKVKIYNITDNMWLSHVTMKSHDLSKKR